METYEFTIDAASTDIGTRLDKYLTEQIPDQSRSYIQKLLDDNFITVNGKSAKSNYKLRAGETITVEIPEAEELDIEPENIPLDIVYEDDDIIVINKPKGMVVHPAPGHTSGTLVNALMYHCKDSLSSINGVLRPGIVHRIDMDTTGLLVACKSDQAHRVLSDKFKVHDIHRVYTAIVYNQLKEKMHAADLFCDATGVGMHPLEDLSNIPDPSFFKKDLIVTDTVYAPRETVMMKQAKEAGIPVISYDRLLMNSDAVSYYATFDNYKVGQKQGEYLVDALDLDNQDGPFNIELFTGDPGDNNCNFFFGGAMDVLQKYIDEGKLVVKSGQTEFEQVATANWDSAKAQDRMDTIIAGNYSDGSNLDAVLCSNDSTALGVENALAASYTGEYPIITGQDCDTPNVKNLVAGKQAMSVFKDTRALASAVVKMVDSIMKGEEPEVNDTKSYDNGTGVIPTYLCDPVVVTTDNYKEILIDSGYYTEDQIK